MTLWYGFLADIVLILHVSYVSFVLAGQVLILLGWWRDWTWTRGFWFRIAHLVAIGAVVLQSWLGIICPLTVLEVRLREAAGQTGYEDMSFIGYWLNRFLFYQASPWVFVVCYTLFGLLVVVTLVSYPPRRRRKLELGGDE